MANMAQCCEYVTKLLLENPEALAALSDAGTKAIGLLNASRTQAVSGFYMCRSMVLQTSIIRKEYQPAPDEFKMSELCEDLGIIGLPQIQLEVCTDAIQADRQLLTCIMFNATQNAMSHGEADGTVVVTATLSEDELYVSVHNRPGVNHDTLLAALQSVEPCVSCKTGGRDLLNAERHALESSGCGDEQSTFQGLNEMRVFASAFRPSADAHVWVQSDGVLFELRVRVTIGAPTTAGSPQGSEDMPLPAGLAFVCCDDDAMPRIFAESLFDRAAADLDKSLILGETYEEVAGLVQQVLEMAERLGDERVLCIFDQNIEFDAGGFTGTDLVQELRARGFSGLLVIQSANDEADDERMYVDAGADGSIGKAVKGGISEMLGLLGQFWHAKYGRPRGANTNTCQHEHRHEH